MVLATKGKTWIQSITYEMIVPLLSQHATFKARAAEMLPNTEEVKLRKAINKAYKEKPQKASTNVFFYLRRGEVPKGLSHEIDEVDNFKCYKMVYCLRNNFPWVDRTVPKTFMGFHILTSLYKQNFPKLWTFTEAKEVSAKIYYPSSTFRLGGYDPAYNTTSKIVSRYRGSRLVQEKDYVLFKTASSRALRESGENFILNSHDFHPDNRLNTSEPCTAEFKVLHTSPETRVEACLPDHAPPIFWESLRTLTSLSSQQISMKTTRDSGHRYLRTLINVLVARSMNEIRTNIVNDPKSCHLIVDLGAKYDKNFKIFEELLCPIVAERQEDGKFKYRVDEDQRYLKSGIPPQNSRYANVVYYPVRMDNGDNYDTKFHALKLTSYHNMIDNELHAIRGAHVDHTPIQEINMVDVCNLYFPKKNVTVHYFANDVHYYLYDWSPSDQKYTKDGVTSELKGIHYTSGLLFPTLPGRGYHAPFSQAVFHIEGDTNLIAPGSDCVWQKVVMETKRSGESYEHYNVLLNSCDTLIDFGFMKIFWDCTMSNNFEIVRVPMPSKAVFYGNPQQAFGKSVLEKIQETSGLKFDLKNSHPFLTDEDYSLTIHRDLVSVPGRIYLWAFLLLLFFLNFTLFLFYYFTSSISTRFNTFIYNGSITFDNYLSFTLFNFTFILIFSIIKIIIDYFIDEPEELPYYQLFLDLNTDYNLVVSDKYALSQRQFFENQRRINAYSPAYKRIIRFGGYQSNFEITPAFKSSEIRENLVADLQDQENDQAVKENKKMMKRLGDLTPTTLTVESDYYMDKPFAKEQITYSPDLIQEDYSDYFSQVEAALSTWCDNNHRSDISDTTTHVTKTGYSVLCSELPVVEFEWSSKSQHNILSALFSRQLAAHQRPDPIHVNKFSSMCDRYWDHFFSKIEPANLLPFNFKLWLDTKDDFSRGKKRKYYQSYLKQKYADDLVARNGDVVYVGCFKSMVKSGEVYFATDLQKDDNGFLQGQDSRPRNISVPCTDSCGTLTCLQSSLWSEIKRIEPGFIQGLTKHDMLDTFKNHISVDMVSISFDGSAFDSSQKTPLLEAADNKFWARMEPYIYKLLEADGWRNSHEQAKRIVLEAQKTKLEMFTHFPGAQLPKIPNKLVNKLKKFTVGKKYQNHDEWFCTPLDGTVFSGHPTRTTLGNTFRSLLYMYYYLEESGVKEPWTNPNLFVAAAGDDTVCWVKPEMADSLTSSILSLSSRTKKSGMVGLGQ